MDRAPIEGHPLGDMLAQLEQGGVSGAMLGPPPRPNSYGDEDADVPEVSFSARGIRVPWQDQARVQAAQTALALGHQVPGLTAARPQRQEGFITITGIDLSTDEVITTAGTVSLPREAAERARQIAIKAVRKAIEEDLGGRRKSVRRVRRSRKPAQRVPAEAPAVSEVRAESVASVEPADGPKPEVPADGGGRKGRVRSKPRVSQG